MKMIIQILFIFNKIISKITEINDIIIMVITMENSKYFWKVILNYYKRLKKQDRIDQNVQKIYNDSRYGYDDLQDSNLLMNLQEYNLQLRTPYLATGQSCYFNSQIENNGLANLKLNFQDMEDAKFISKCFGVETHYSENEIPITYTTLLGTTEFNYATQTFPAGIFEDVFQCSPNHNLPIQPKVGELEQEFFLRLLEHQIDVSSIFNKEKKQEALFRGKRLIENFCNGKNRVYLIELSDVLQIKASFGDIVGLRDGTLTNEESKNKIESLKSLNELMDGFNINLQTIYLDPNMSSEYGVALYGNISTNSLKYIEVERKYYMMQKKAIDLGYQIGDTIPLNLSEEFSKNNVFLR